MRLIERVAAIKFAVNDENANSEEAATDGKLFWHMLPENPTTLRSFVRP